MKPEGLLFSLELDIGSYPEPDESSPYLLILFF
jgi:hypothetical protein